MHCEGKPSSPFRLYPVSSSGGGPTGIADPASANYTQKERGKKKTQTKPNNKPQNQTQKSFTSLNVILQLQ